MAAGGQCMCMFSIEIQTTGTGSVKGVQGVVGASAMHFGKNCKKQKLQCVPDLIGVGHL